MTTIKLDLEPLQALLEAGVAHLNALNARGGLFEEKARALRDELRAATERVATAAFDARCPMPLNPPATPRTLLKGEVPESEEVRS